MNICRIIDEAKQSVAVSVHSALTMMYWHIGKSIDSFVLDGRRAEYGIRIVSTVSTQLTVPPSSHSLYLNYTRNDI